MSVLFHQKVPDDFIAAVFEVMKKGHLHQFQVLTKRPERMAAFTGEYFKNEEPPANIWLGTSTENQAAFDERIPWLRKTIAAVRWLSYEPLLGPIVFDSPRHIDWVVVGGESDSHRKMEKAWATSLRDQCRQARVPFFFKQWGSFDESGHGPAKEKHDKLTPPPIDGEIHNAYPVLLRPGERASAVPHRVQLRRAKGWQKPANTVSVARPTQFGNPFPVAEYGREQAIAKFETWIQQPQQRSLLADARQTLRGKNLAC